MRKVCQGKDSSGTRGRGGKGEKKGRKKEKKKSMPGGKRRRVEMGGRVITRGEESVGGLSECTGLVWE